MPSKPNCVHCLFTRDLLPMFSSKWSITEYILCSLAFEAPCNNDVTKPGTLLSENWEIHFNDLNRRYDIKTRYNAVTTHQQTSKVGSHGRRLGG